MGRLPLFNPRLFFCWTIPFNKLILNIIAAAKSLQSCPTLCDPIDGNPPGSAVPGILQARTLEWAAISFSNAWKWKVKVKSLSHVRPSATPWTAAYQAPPSMGFSGKSTGVGCQCLLLRTNSLVNTGLKLSNRPSHLSRRRQRSPKSSGMLWPMRKPGSWQRSGRWRWRTARLPKSWRSASMRNSRWASAWVLVWGHLLQPPAWSLVGPVLGQPLYALEHSHSALWE